MNLQYFYTSQQQKLEQQILLLKHKGRVFVAGEITLFILFVAFLVLYTLVSWGILSIVLSMVSLILYGVVRYMDIKNEEKIHRLSNLKQVYLHELSYLQGDYSCFDNGEQYVDAHHPFTFDLDVFGNNSLFQRINRTVTTGGSDYLAAQLSSTDNHSDRADAVNELAQKEQLRADFMALGQDGRIDSSRIQKVLNNINQAKISAQFAKKFVPLWIAYLLIVGLWLSIVASIFGWVNAQLPIWWTIFQFFGILFVCGGACKAISTEANKLYEQLKNYVKVIRLVSSTSFKTSQNKAIANNLQQALSAFEQLDVILNALDRRGNILGMFIMNAFFLSDFFLVRKFLRWQGQYLEDFSNWIALISELDALVSMATFRYNEPQSGRAEVIERDSMVYEAIDLYHPFLGAKAVKNNFYLQHQHYYIITGANMAGKSTFLRALGINYLLAMNGMPVFASSLRVSVYHLFSSMRTTDDLAHGISYFNAELLRLQQLIDYCKHNKHTLIILDEILKGTNSLDKLNGSRLFLQSISSLPVTGVIATHDLELSKMQGERYHNYCFEIALVTQVSYSYKVIQGVARNQNATFLLKEILGSLQVKNHSVEA